MVTLTKIYTRGGDKGLTSLSDGSRVPKHHPRVAAYGEVDEANATIGLVRLHCQDRPEADALLARIQNDLFDLGADLATPEPAEDAEPLPYEPLRVTAAQVERLEREIDALNAELAPLKSFVLPGGGAASAHLHLARTVTRRAERLITAFAESERINPEAVRYVNRLSDLLFVLARHMNEKGGQDVLWVPGQHREGAAGKG